MDLVIMIAAGLGFVILAFAMGLMRDSQGKTNKQTKEYTAKLKERKKQQAAADAMERESKI